MGSLEKHSSKESGWVLSQWLHLCHITKLYELFCKRKNTVVIELPRGFHNLQRPMHNSKERVGISVGCGQQMTLGARNETASPLSPSSQVFRIKGIWRDHNVSPLSRFSPECKSTWKSSSISSRFVCVSACVCVYTYGICYPWYRCIRMCIGVHANMCDVFGIQRQILVSCTYSIFLCFKT